MAQPSFSSFMDSLSSQSSLPQTPSAAALLEALPVEPALHDEVAEPATDGPPIVYRHLSCGCETELPARVIEISQVDPCYYNGFTYCSSCNANWHQSDFKWVATRENVHAYYKRMFREKPASYKVFYYLTWPPASVAWCALAGWLGGLAFGGPAFVLAGVGAGVGLVLGLGPAKSLRYGILRALQQ